MELLFCDTTEKAFTIAQILAAIGIPSIDEVHRITKTVRHLHDQNLWRRRILIGLILRIIVVIQPHRASHRDLERRLSKQPHAYSSSNMDAFTIFPSSSKVSWSSIGNGITSSIIIALSLCAPFPR